MDCSARPIDIPSVPLSLAVAISLAALGFAPAAGAADVEGFQRGDCNADGSRNISDIIYLLEYMFESTQPPECLDDQSTWKTANSFLSVMESRRRNMAGTTMLMWMWQGKRY